MPDYNAYISEASRRFGVPEAWIRSVIGSESAGRANALGPMTRFGTQAQGLMQIMPDTYAELAQKHKLGPDPFDPRNNILGGTAYLSELAQRFQGDPSAVLHAYNMGPNAYEQTRTGPRKVPAETVAYVNRTLPGMQGPWKAPGQTPGQASAAPPDQQSAFNDMLTRVIGPGTTAAPDAPGPAQTATPQPLPEVNVGPPPGGVVPPPAAPAAAPSAGGLLDRALSDRLSGLLGEIGPDRPEPTGLPWYDRFAEWATRPPGPLQSSLLGVATAVAPLAGWRTGAPVSTAEVLAAAAGGLFKGGQDYRQGQLQRLETALKLEQAQTGRTTTRNKIEAARRYAAALRQTNDPRLMRLAEAIELDPSLLDEAIKSQFPKPGSLKTVNTAEGVFVVNPDGSRGERIGGSPSSSRQAQVKTVTTADGIFVVNPDGSLGNRLGDAPAKAAGLKTVTTDAGIFVLNPDGTLGNRLGDPPPKGAGPKTVTTSEGVFVLNPDGSLGNRLGASETAPDLGVAGQPPDPNLALQVGVPLPARAPWDNPGLSARGKSNLVTQERTRLNKRFEDNDEQVAKATALTQDMQRFLFLNERTETGGVLNAPITGAARAFFDSDLKEMRSITARITPTLRQPGSGATSDFDARMFQEGTVGADKPREVNKNIAQAAIAAAENIAGKAAFERAYGETWGHLNGADAAWRRYLEANPIFDRAAPTGSFTLNPGRRTWQEFFRAEMGGTPPPDATQTPPTEFSTMTPEQLRAVDVNSLNAEQLKAFTAEAERRAAQGAR